jgi:RNA polymerase sigma-70 factor, ECF subfamily
MHVNDPSLEQAPAMAQPLEHAQRLGYERLGYERIEYDRQDHMTLENLTDPELVMHIAAGSEAALCEVYDRFSRLIYSIARRILRENAEAEDVVQDVFVKLWAHALEYKATHGSVSTWLMTITHRTAIDQLRRRTVRATIDVEERELLAHPDPKPNTELLLDRIGLSGALASLKPEERELVELAFLEGLSHAQLVERTGLPLGTIKTRLRSSLLRLREVLGDWAHG